MNNPARYIDPSGHVVCENQEDCSATNRSWGKTELESFASNLFSWNISGDFTRNQIIEIIKSGNIVKSRMDELTDGSGLDWIQSNLGSTSFVKNNDSISLSNILGASAFVWPYNTVNFGSTFIGEGDLIHELGHVIDNNLTPGILPATVLGGGPSDQMVGEMGGQPGWCVPRMQCTDFLRFSALSYSGYQTFIAGSNPFNEDNYANHSVSDDFAQAFLYAMTNDGSIIQGLSRVNWMTSFLTSLPY